MSYRKPLCDCAQPVCPVFKRLDDAWHTRRRLELLHDKAADEWRSARDAYDTHLLRLAKDAA